MLGTMNYAERIQIAWKTSRVSFAHQNQEHNVNIRPQANLRLVAQHRVHISHLGFVRGDI
jgi:hypothetical protein